MKKEVEQGKKEEERERENEEEKQKEQRRQNNKRGRRASPVRVTPRMEKQPILHWCRLASWKYLLEQPANTLPACLWQNAEGCGEGRIPQQLWIQARPYAISPTWSIQYIYTP